MSRPFLSNTTYFILFVLLAAVYVAGLFVPLMDNDAAHHALIALRMYLTGDYVNLIDNGKDYLDKPHLHFWLAALSYHLFDVSSFAYKFPSFVFTILGTYSTYWLGRALYDAETGRLASLLVATAFGYMLANNDVRMDAILTASIVFATWQLVEWIHHKKNIFALGAALGMALGFATKGHIAIITPAVGAFFYILYRREWKLFFHPQLLLIIAAFFLLIAPVVYCYYLQYDLHPEKVIRGRSGRSGVAFILWNQSIERFEGESFGADAKNDYLFFIHSFLWAFAPWSLLAFAAFFQRIKTFTTRNYEWLTTGSFAVILLVISLSGFKLPHYLNIIFPAASVFTAAWLLQRIRNKKENTVWVTQLVVCILMFVIVMAINVWAFPLTSIWKIVFAILLLAVVFHFLRKPQPPLQKAVTVSAAMMIFAFFLLNTNFYPQLLNYQAGRTLAKIVNQHIGAQRVYFWPGIYSSSLNYYAKSLRQPFHDSLLNAAKEVWVVTDQNKLAEVEAQYETGRRYSHVDYEITQLDLNFINPATRAQAVGRLWLVEVRGRKP